MLLRLLLASALTLPMFAFADDRYDRNRRYDRRDQYEWNDRYERSNRGGRWSRPDRSRDRNMRPGYGYGTYRDPYAYGNSGRSAINRAMQNLQSAAARNRVDGHERDHFTRADQINPRDRQLFARDRQALASIYGGYGYNRLD